MKKHILLIDDDEDELKIFTEALDRVACTLQMHLGKERQTSAATIAVLGTPHGFP